MTLKVNDIANLLYDPEYEHLNSLFNAFNPLKVLRIDAHEIRHSNILAWLLNPKENHNLGHLFIEKLLGRLLIKVENFEKMEDANTYIKLLSITHNDWIVEREKGTDKNKRIDLLLHSIENKMVILIENKFYSTQSKGQLRNYLDYCESTYPDYILLPIFLTLHNEDDPTEKYWTLNYSDIAETLESILKLQKESLSEDVYSFLQHYLSVVHEQFAPDENRLRLAESLFTKHGEAISAIYLSTNNSVKKHTHHKYFRELVSALSKEEQNWVHKIYQENNQTIDFIFTEDSLILKKAFENVMVKREFKDEYYKAVKSTPYFIFPEWKIAESFLKEMEHPEIMYWLGYGIIIFFKRRENGYLKVYIEIGPMKYSSRLELLKRLEQKGLSIKESSKLPTSVYTRIYTNQIKVEDWMSIHTLEDSISSLIDDLTFIEVKTKITEVLLGIVK
ncbi:PDDEXK-like family protein [Psychrobacillus sp. FSL K6-1415]|uniref:PDDEXK-like family protein n=1 Tax=Psychrobacillus sp. FSL K6-1415 TaxID=2921544 RepID=UPI0030F6F250